MDIKPILDFKKAFSQAEQVLKFLETEHNFEVYKRTIDHGYGCFGMVTYAETPKIRFMKRRFVSLSTTPARLELDLDIGRGPERYSMQELHALEDGGKFPERTHDFHEMAQDAAQMTAEFSRLTTILRECGKRFFANDDSLWSDLAKQRELAIETDHMTELSLYAEKALQNKDWKKIIDLLEPHEAKLDKLALARLDYARKQIK